MNARLSITLLAAAALLYAYLRQRRKRVESLRERYGDGGWCLVTGASSGIGAEFAMQLARRHGFKVLLVARREDMLEERIRALREAGVSGARALVYDLGDLGSVKEEFGAKFAKRVEEITGEEGLAMVVHMAGNSDLALHITDKSIERNVEVMNLCVTSTLVIVQRMIPLLLKRRMRHPEFRTAVITSGALTAIVPGPPFTCSSANKHYVRALTLALAIGFEKDGIDFMCAHPIAVFSEILVNPIPGAIEASVFCEGVLDDLGTTLDSCGHWTHDLISNVLTWLPFPWVARGLLAAAPRFSMLLNRPIDTRDIKVKLGLVPEA